MEEEKAADFLKRVKRAREDGRTKPEAKKEGRRGKDRISLPGREKALNSKAERILLIRRGGGDALQKEKKKKKKRRDVLTATGALVRKEGGGGTPRGKRKGRGKRLKLFLREE